MEGPFVMESLFSNGAYRLAKLDDEVIMTLVKDKFFKKYYP